MQVIQGTQEYDIRANWKLLVENSFDDYHLLSTHSTWLDYLKNSGVEMKRPGKGEMLPSHGAGKDLGNGHGTTDNINFRGRPVARWIPIYGEAAKPELEKIRAELVARHAGHPGNAGIRYPRELEAAGREQLRRQPPSQHALHLARLPQELRRRDEAARQRRDASVARRGQGSRQRPRHHRQHQLPRPARGALDPDLRRGGS